MTGGEVLAQLGSIIAALMFAKAFFEQYFPQQLRRYAERLYQRVTGRVSPYIDVTFNEFTGEYFMRSEAFSAIDNYLGSSAPTQARKLKGDIGEKTQSVVLSMDKEQEVVDVFRGAQMWWKSGTNPSKTESRYPGSDERRFYTLVFHKQHRDIATGPYLDHVFKEGKAIKWRNRQRKIYTNRGWYWTHVAFEHPASFESIAMEPEKKREIIDDLTRFSKAQDLYARIGRAWKRGYLLYGPPGTGKSTMIAAMANLLGYNIYDLELTAVADNTELRSLLIATSRKSIIVIEDIDCSLDLTAQRKKKEAKDEEEEVGKAQNNSKVTLSGLLNIIDGLWSTCGGERLIVFTTNFVEKLDPALIRRGRMDKHIELSYCGFEAFKILARNYLNVESHDLFGSICELLRDVDITPADVAEHLMPKGEPVDAQVCLENLVQALKEAKQDRSLKENSTTTDEDEKDEEEVSEC